MRECPRCERCYTDEVLICPEEGSNTKHTLPGGTVLAGRYLLEKRLGRGAMGQVYLARDQNFGTRKVAVKTVRPDILLDEEMQEGEAIARFEREARTAASIQHPNVVGVSDFGKSPEGVFFLVMEYVQGETLHHLLRREGTLSPQRALTLLRQIAAGVEAAHDEGILHRDLKPANIFIMQNRKKSGSGDGFVKVGDFGLAKIVNQAVSEIDSASGPASRGIIGTPEFMAPEQMQPNAQLDARADVYALGTIAYQMLVGRPPFSGELTQLIMQKLMNTPQPPSAVRSDISPAVERAVMHALEKEPIARPASVVDWLDEFEQAVGTSSESTDTEDSRVVIVAPQGAEVYVDDERYGSIGRSGRLILSSIPPGRHILRVARAGEHDDERVIQINPDPSEQIIQVQLRPTATPSQQGSQPGSSGITGPSSILPGIVMCAQCSSRFAAGVKFCGRCGGTLFLPVSEQGGNATVNQPQPPSQPGRSVAAHASEITCQRCGFRFPPTTKFCGRCGATVASGSTMPGGVSGVNMGNASMSPPQPLVGQRPHAPQQPPAAPPARAQGVYCAPCGTSYPPGTRFCGRCGNTIGA
ncbi:MAG TPA: serine/threonine-protein kinase [Pyrinomonadaceae bacterium]|nr:serine/threonine-protein kinase [Pyrinomonadaceae bacterium]